jgi:hypothetical protein
LKESLLHRHVDGDEWHGEGIPSMPSSKELSTFGGEYCVAFRRKVEALNMSCGRLIAVADHKL